MRLKLISLMFSYFTVIQNFATEASPISNDSDWRFVFEDDIAAVPSKNLTTYTQAIKSGMEIARGKGLLFLGLCAPACGEAINKGGKVEYALCEGLCSHAFGISKWKAKVFIKELNDLCINYGNMHRRICTQPCIKEHFCVDQLFRMYSMHNGRIHLVGSNLFSPLNQAQAGIFYQDQLRFHSSIGI